MQPTLRCISLCTLCLCLLGLFCACGQETVTQDFSYVNSTFTLSLQGELYPTKDTISFAQTKALGKLRDEPLPFAAKITVTPVSAGAVHEGSADGGQILNRPAWQVKITYTAPEGLSGLSVSCIYSHPDHEAPEALDSVTVTYPSPTGKLRVPFPDDSIRGLLLPALLLLPYGQITAVSPVADGQHTVERSQSGIGLANGTLTYRFSTDAPNTAGYPLTVTWTGDNSRGHMYIS